MSFYEDFILHCLKATASVDQLKVRLGEAGFAELLERRGISPELMKQEDRYSNHIATRMLHAKIIKMRGEQAEVFLDSAVSEGQDFIKWLRLPFTGVFLEFGPTFVFKNYIQEIDYLSTTALAANEKMPEREIERMSKEPGDSPPVRGCLIVERSATDMLTAIDLERNSIKFDDLALSGGQSVKPTEMERMFEIVFFMPPPDSLFVTHSASLIIKKDNSLIILGSGGVKQMHKKLVQFAVHCINFLASPSVKLVRREPDAALQKARKRKGKDPLPGWYEITYRKVIGDYAKSKVTERQFTHSFRYDVRGHFKCFGRGPMAGRVIWCPAHQRGLKNPVYKPKGYKIVQ